jgi:hypothetical protein
MALMKDISHAFGLHFVLYNPYEGQFQYRFVHEEFMKGRFDYPLPFYSGDPIETVSSKQRLSFIVLLVPYKKKKPASAGFRNTYFNSYIK